jgi:novobiocin biosynthesis protein NovU/D-mycarose 3-C-methyltransferase
VCLSSKLEIVWDLPSLPLTGVYVTESTNPGFKNEYDQKLQFCTDCGHGELENKIDPLFLYRDTYTHRTSESAISAQGNIFLQNFVSEIIANKKIKQVLEIGCNDLYLLENIDFGQAKLSGIDPIWNDGAELKGRVNVLGGFAESADYSLIVSEPIDLVISAHTFEHIIEPRVALEKLVPYLAKDATFIIEVPSAERMLDQVRLDQVFSQHVNYYSVSSLTKLFSDFSFGLQNIKYNFGYWGGTQLLEFKLGESSKIDFKRPEDLLVQYENSIMLFRKSIEVSVAQLESVVGEIVAYGAAQMLPILAYHFGDSFKKISVILDDNLNRQGKFFPNLEQKIISSSKMNLSEINVLVTALDSARPITKRLIELAPRSIITPLGII